MPAWTNEEAKEHGRLGGLASAAKRRRIRETGKDVLAREAFVDAAPAMAAELVKAAKGEGVYEELPVAERVKLMTKVLEFGIGRPGSGPKHEPKAEEPEEGDGHGFVIGGGDGA